MTQPELIPTPAAAPAKAPTIADQHAALEARYGKRPGQRYVKPARCRHCKAWTLRGLDADLGAFPASVDLHPLDALGEALAQIAGTATYQLVRRGRGAALQRRTRHSIACWPAGGPGPGGQSFDVLSEHRCQPLNLPTIPSVFTIANTNERNTTNECPY